MLRHKVDHTPTFIRSDCLIFHTPVPSLINEKKVIMDRGRNRRPATHRGDRHITVGFGVGLKGLPHNKECGTVAVGGMSNRTSPHWIGSLCSPQLQRQRHSSCMSALIRVEYLDGDQPGNHRGTA